jgi:hypothetical protein
VGVGVQVLAQQRDQKRGQRNGAGGLGGLGRPEVELPVHFVQRPDPRVDDQAAGAVGLQVEVVAVQAGELTPPGAGPGRGDQE